MDQRSPLEFPHRRYNPLKDEWVLVAPQRLDRPWHGQTETPPQENNPPYDPHCYLCPGNERASGTRNHDYTGTYVFTNDYASLLPEIPGLPAFSHPLMRVKGEAGTCRVMCFSERHDLTLAEMSVEEIRRVVDMWAGQTIALGKDYRWVQLFENKGRMMGCSNPHPHGQVWGQTSLPSEIAGEDTNQRGYFHEHRSPLLLDYVELEREQRDRVVVENEHWLAVVPFWALWPFEILLLPQRHVLRLPDLNDAERDALAHILKRLLTRYDNLFETSFPYSMGWHGAPIGDEDYRYWQLHAHFYPPLLRSATVKKFMVGYEILGEGQRDLTPEQAATRLRNLSETHYRATPP